MAGKITEDELRGRLTAHLRARPEKDVVAAVWHGYLAGLVEWGLIDLATYSNLSELLPSFGQNEVTEIMQGFEDD